MDTRLQIKHSWTQSTLEALSKAELVDAITQYTETHREVWSLKKQAEFAHASRREGLLLKKEELVACAMTLLQHAVERHQQEVESEKRIRQGVLNGEKQDERVQALYTGLLTGIRDRIEEEEAEISRLKEEFADDPTHAAKWDGLAKLAEAKCILKYLKLAQASVLLGSNEEATMREVRNEIARVFRGAEDTHNANLRVRPEDHEVGERNGARASVSLGVSLMLCVEKAMRGEWDSLHANLIPRYARVQTVSQFEYL